MGWHNSLSTLPYGDRFKLMRKWIQNAFQKKEALEVYQDAQKREVNVFLNNILSTPDAWAAHCTRCVL